MSETHTTPEDYAKFVTQLGSQYTMANFLSKVGTMGLGLAGESAEILTISMKYANDCININEDDRVKVIDEIGDICWYVAFSAANVVEVPFKDLIPVGIPHLSEVYPAQSLRYLSSALAMYCGTIADISKKLVYHGKPFTEEVKVKLVDTLRTIIRNVTFIVKDVCRAELQDSINKNVAKLSERYKSLKFSTEEFMEKEEGKRI
jgi:hypothetical protein